MRTEDLISSLAQDLSPRWPLGRVFGVGAGAGVLAAGLLFAAGLGVRPDIEAALGTVRFVLKLALALALACAALGLLLPLARPGAARGGWTWALAAVPVVLGLAVLCELVAMPEATWGPRLIGRNALTCLLAIPALAAAPLACLMACLRFGAPTRPGLAGAVAGLAATGIGASFYASHCPDDSPLFVVTWYGTAAVLVTSAGFLAGRRLPRW